MDKDTESRLDYIENKYKELEVLRIKRDNPKTSFSKANKINKQMKEIRGNINSIFELI